MTPFRDAAGITSRSVVWHGTDPFSAEVLRLSERDGGWEMSGTVVVALGEDGAAVRYAVWVDAEWRTRRVDVELDGTPGGSLRLEADGNGSWALGGRRVDELDGCIDVDLGVSPATNTLPIRRLRPSVGETVSTRVAWVRFPELTVEPDDQTYDRTAERTYVFRSDDFEADIEVDADAIVVRYGDLWRVMLASGG